VTGHTISNLKFILKFPALKFLRNFHGMH